MSTTNAGAAPVVALLHSLGTDRSVWQKQSASLERAGYRVLAPESRGHGASPWRPGVSFDGWVADLHAFLRQECDGPVHLVGLTMGGMQAIAYAAAHPDMIRSLVLVGTFARLDPATRDRRLAGIRADIETFGMAGFAEAYLDETLVTDAAGEPRRVLARAIARAHPEAYLASSELCFNADLTGLLPGLRAPTLVVAGERDLKTPIAVSRELAASIPGARLVVLEGAGHLSNVDAPDAFDDHLLAFLDEVENGHRTTRINQDEGRGVDQRV